MQNFKKDSKFDGLTINPFSGYPLEKLTKDKNGGYSYRIYEHVLLSVLNPGLASVKYTRMVFNSLYKANLSGLLTQHKGGLGELRVYDASAEEIELLNKLVALETLQEPSHVGSNILNK